MRNNFAKNEHSLTIKFETYDTTRILKIFNDFFLVALGIYGIQRHFQQYFSYIVAVNFIGGVNRTTQRKPSKYRKSLTNFIT